MRPFVAAAVLVGGMLIGAATVLVWRAPPAGMSRNAPASVETFDCDPHAGACEATRDDVAVWLSLAPPIRPLEPLPLVLKVAGREVTDPSVAFTMVDMDMGTTRYGFLPAGDGRWLAEVMLPICSAGRRDWLATVEFTADGEPLAVAFRFLSDR